MPPSHYEPGAPPTGQRADHRRARRAGSGRDRGARGGPAVSTAVTRDAEGTVTGNTYDKYGSTNPVVQAADGGLRAHARRAVRAGRAALGARRRLRRGRAHPQVGAAARTGRVVGIDLEDPAIQAEWAQAPGAEPRVPGHEGRGPAVRATASSTLAAAIEVLEHVPDPEHTVAEMARVARGAPARLGARASRCGAALNMARGAYLQRPREHARPPEPLVQARRSWSCCRGTARSWRPARRSRGPCCSSVTSP